MSISYTVVLVLLDDEVIVDISARGWLQSAQDCATVIFPSLRANETLRINFERVTAVRLWPFNDFDAEALSLIDLLRWHHYRSQRQVGHSINLVL